MIKTVGYASECVGCADCIGCGRKYRKHPVRVFECDDCGTEGENLELFDYCDQQLCKGCLLYKWLTTENIEDVYDKLVEMDVDESLADEFDLVEDDE